MANNPEISGPAGGCGGDGWDDGSIYTGIRQINISYGQAISNFQVIYDLNDHIWPGTPHPAGIGLDGVVNKTIPLQFPNEFLKSVTVYVDPVPGYATDVIRSIKFTTNRQTYGPYGIESGTSFESTIPPTPFGFIGRTSQDYLDAIGVHVQGQPLQN